MSKFMAFLIKSQESTWAQIAALGLLTGLFVIALGNYHQGFVLIGSMILHEFGHWAVFNMAGIRAKVMVLFPLGAVALPINERENQRSDKLPYWTICWLTLSGLLVNATIILLGIAFKSLGAGEIKVWGEAMIFVNALLMGLNLPPAFNLDGGIFFRAISSSMKRKQANILAGALSSIAVLTLVFISGMMVDQNWKHVLVALLMNYGKVFLLLIFIGTVWGSVNHKDKLMPVVPGSLKSWQVTVLIATYCLMVTLIFVVV